MGILLGNYFFFEGIRLSFTFSLLILPLFLFLLCITYRTFRQYSARWLFGLLGYSFFLVFGICWQNVNLQQTVVDFPTHESIYRVVVTEHPEQKERSILCNARIMPEACHVLLYFSLDSIGKELSRGDELLVSTGLSLPASRGNPEEFDYARYLIHKGISGTGFVSSGKWIVTKHHTQRTMRDYATDCRDDVLALYRNLGFEQDNFAVLSALTVGYKEELSESIRESYSVSGASHVLALSGLHIGFLYALLFFLLQRIPGNSTGMKAFKVGTVILLLWLFAFITGFSPSVVRSVIMFSLLGISMFFPDRPVSLNTLCIAGFAMLIYNPSWLFDVGFQLSFMAVAAILLIQPWIYKRFIFKNRFLNWLWGIVTVSIAAQIGVAPLVLLYFSRFSVHFLLTNILVIPLVTLIIYMAIGMLLLSFIPVVGQMIAWALNLLLELLNGVVSGIEKLPFASVDHVWVYRFEVILFYLALLLLGWYVVRRRPRFILAFLTVVLMMSVYRVYMIEADRPRQSLVFYNVRNCPVVHCILPDGRSWLAYADTVPDDQRLTRVASGYWNRLRLSSPVPVLTDYAENCFIRHNNILSFGGKRICIINDNRWREVKTESPFPVDCLYLCKNYTGRIEGLTSVFNIQHVVLDSSLSDYRRKVLQEECTRLNIPLTSLSEQASYFKYPI
ncbi:ComEC/Rec2 family competence protein [Bacteroides sp. 51]|uniref:ComEC/Rec2 family competence protein n=1 Tax=Bacteroides sp. 51 TaxID=2302938 RepID=UPI0013D7FBAF|nr:ComEC/Rec2 family competence protein [Bacteroides sp. 51]NDV81178.1 ComEC family competence protein [Bacteroides sp. 51]